MGMQRSFGVLAVAAVLASGVTLAQKPQVSDAQVEANVLKALASDASLTNQPIQSSTAFGVVTLTGAVQDDAARDRAEQIASRTTGVKKVVDQLAVGAQAVASASTTAPAAAPTQQNDGADDDPASRNVLPGDAAAVVGPNQQQGGQDGAAGQIYPLPGQGDPQVGMTPQQYPQNGQYPQSSPYPQAGQYPPPQAGGYPQNGQYPQGQYPPQGYSQGQGSPQDGSYGPPNGRIYRRDWERQQAAQRSGQQGYMQRGQLGGQAVVVPAGVVLPVRITRWVSSGDAQPGSQFTAIVDHDILAGGLIAIPRGAELQGTVVEAKGAGVLKGRGELVLQLNTLLLGGQQVPVISDTFRVNGHDKAARSVNSTIIGGAIGALIGAAAGGGTGAAIGAGVGGAAGLGTSAASHGGNVDIPAEALLQFRLDAPLSVVTVSEAEMQRLGNYAGPNGARGPMPGPGYGYGAPVPYARPYPGYYGY